MQMLLDGPHCHFPKPWPLAGDKLLDWQFTTNSVGALFIRPFRPRWRVWQPVRRVDQRNDNEKTPPTVTAAAIE
jgi:hypothetical protein